VAWVGASVAKYLRLWSNRTVSVTLIEQSASYTSNIMSNLALTGQVSMSSLKYGYSNLVSKYGVKLVTAAVTGLAPLATGGWRVTVKSATGAVSSYDAERVVLAPGIQFDVVPETNDTTKAATILHAWQAGPQTDALRTQLTGMSAGGTFIMSIPAKPYRCPPGPYERACVVADYLKRNKPNAKIIVLDANPGIVAEKENFTYAFQTLYGDVLQYVPDTSVLSVNSATKAVTARTVTRDASAAVTGSVDKVYQSNVLNVIPPHRAGAVVQLAGLSNATDIPFAKVDPRSFESVSKPGLYVIGDAHQTAGVGGSGLPMAGHVGNQGAKICASAIINAFAGKSVSTLDTTYLTANSACFSPVSNTKASWLTAVYHYNSSQGKYVIYDDMNPTSTAATEAAGPNTENFSQMNTWFKSLMTDTFS